MSVASAVLERIRFVYWICLLLMTVCFGLLGCDAAERRTCEVPGIGHGACCVLVLPGSITARGICREGVCTNGTYSLAMNVCGYEAPPIPDLGVDQSVNPVGDFAALLDAAADASRPDMEVSGPCDTVVCPADQICHGIRGRCVPRSFGRPGGACFGTTDCRRGLCQRSPLADSNALGYCHSICNSDVDCDEGVCVDDSTERVCRRRCTDDGHCLVGWTCDDNEGSNQSGTCQPDCRLLGCPGHRSCDRMTGMCSSASQRCTYPCRAGESCEDGRCVRANGTCVTTYHCSPQDECFRGRCIRVEGAACINVEDCAEIQRCAPDSQGVGHCAVLCQFDDDCHIHRLCDPRTRVCTYRPCGDGVGTPGLFESCAAISQTRGIGTCLPLLSLGEESPNLQAGYCHEAGNAAVGEACDLQSTGRTPDERALLCTVGAYCIDDPDDPLEPVLQHLGRGTCRSVCRRGIRECHGAEQCVRIAPRDDPETTVMEGYDLAVCRESNCRLFQSDCVNGEHCEPFNLWSTLGICRRAGPVGPGGFCETASDCITASQCVSQIGGKVCMSVCEPDGSPCLRGRCYQEPTWGYGFCVGS